MVAMRVLEERPVVGGEKFSTVVGPSREFRRLTRTALALSLLGAVCAAAAASAGSVAPIVWKLSGLFFAIALGSAWVSGGAEEIVFQGGVLRVRRAGPLGERGRIVPVGEIRSIAGPGGARFASFAGIRLVTTRGPLAVGRGLRAEEARWLAGALGRHLDTLHRGPDRPLASPFRPEAAAPPQVLERKGLRR